MPMVWIKEESQRIDDDLPYLSTMTLSVTVYSTDWRDATGEAALRGDGDEDGAATARGLDQMARRVAEQIGYLGRTYVDIRNVQTQWDAYQMDQSTWIAYRSIRFTATVNTDSAFVGTGIIYTTGTLALTPTGGDDISLGEVSNLTLNVKELDLTSDGEDEGGGWNDALEGAYLISVDCDFRGWDDTREAIFRTFQNNGAGVRKPRYTLVYTPRDAGAGAFEFTLRDVTVNLLNMRAQMAPTREFLRRVTFRSVSDGASANAMLTMGVTSG